MKGKYLITGGTGTLGQELVKQLLPTAEKIIVFSRDEHKQIEMARKFQSDNISYTIGDVRDRNRIFEVMQDIDLVIHTAAQKHVLISETNPFEAVKTNIIGSQNVIDAAINGNVLRVLSVSSDKAVNPISLYGATKLCADRLFIAANNRHFTKFTVIRFGNFIGSRGSVIPYWKRLIANGVEKLPITSKNMVRYWIKIEDAAFYAIKALQIMNGGEIFCPKMEEKRLIDIAKEMMPDYMEFDEIGIQRGEKYKEELWTEYDEVQERGGMWEIHS